MARYQIIDEPQSKPWAETIIVDPTIILLASFIVPLIWNPPMFGRFWIPLLWLAANGYALGSASLKKELLTSVAGVAAMLALVFGVFHLLETGVLSVPSARVWPYLSLLLFGIFFLTLYSIIFRQTVSYQLYRYSRGDSA